MNKDEVISMIVKILLMILSPIAAQQHIDGNTMTAIATDIADLAVLAYGIYSHWNMKKVPETVVITPVKP